MEPQREQPPQEAVPEPQQESNSGPRPAVEVPKEDAPQDAPPAYTPPPRTRLQEAIAAALRSNPNAHVRQLGQRLMAMPVPSATIETAIDGEDEPTDELSPINLRICTRVNVARDNNLVALPYSPADQASATAEAIVKAFKSTAISEGGIPMIDQDGHPRPIKIEVDAGITIEGTNNVIGTEDVISSVLRSRVNSISRLRPAGMASAAGPSFGPSAGPSSSLSTSSTGLATPLSLSSGGIPSRRRSADEAGMDTDVAPGQGAAKKARNQEERPSN